MDMEQISNILDKGEPYQLPDKWKRNTIDPDVLPSIVEKQRDLCIVHGSMSGTSTGSQVFYTENGVEYPKLPHPSESVTSTESDICFVENGKEVPVKRNPQRYQFEEKEVLVRRYDPDPDSTNDSDLETAPSQKKPKKAINRQNLIPIFEVNLVRFCVQSVCLNLQVIHNKMLLLLVILACPIIL